MGLFFDVLSAVNNPDQQANVDQLDSLVHSVQQLSQQAGIDAATAQNLISAAGSFIRPVLQQQSEAMGSQQLASMISQVSGGGNLIGSLPGQSSSETNPLTDLMNQATAAAGGGNTGLLQGLFPSHMQQQMAQSIAQKTGLNPSMVQSILPTLIPIVLNFLNMGASKPGTSGGANPVLSTFLNSDRDADTDLGEVIKFATRFVQHSS
jgi:hypothetical protein